jgi:hypothetical protein
MLAMVSQQSVAVSRAIIGAALGLVLDFGKLNMGIAVLKYLDCLSVA